ncbi:MAG: chemotaxis-specific protein-glutamate methyltransferase CheB [Bacteroidota bacterium]
MANDRIRVLIVEDTLTGQGLLKGILAQDSRFEVIATAVNGTQAVEFVAKFHPDVVSMDIYMPVMDGVVATRHIMQRNPVPIVIVSSFYTQDEIKMSFKILEAGALTILPKPFGPGHPQHYQTAKHYRNTLKMMSGIKVKNLAALPAISPKPDPVTSSGRAVAGSTVTEFKIIAIGASAGGPLAIQEILSNLPDHLPVPLLIVQHIDGNFAEGFSEWLNTASNLPVHIGVDGEIMRTGHVYLAPGDCHLGVQSEGVISITKDPAEKNLRPAVSYLFRRIAAVYGKKAVCILLSGMGTDGAMELKALREKGAFTIAQNAQTSLVHGMPGEAIKLGAACLVLTPSEIVIEIRKILTI